MSEDTATQQDWESYKKEHELSGHELVEDLILQNQTLDALIEGLTGDIEIFKNDTEGRWTPEDIVRFTLQLNVMRDKKKRNLLAINEMVKKEHSNN